MNRKQKIAHARAYAEQKNFEQKHEVMRLGCSPTFRILQQLGSKPHSETVHLTGRLRMSQWMRNLRAIKGSCAFAYIHDGFHADTLSDDPVARPIRSRLAQLSNHHDDLAAIRRAFEVNSNGATTLGDSL